MTDDPKGPEPRIVDLAEANDPAFGGKARGLARLIGMGLPVPAGFVIVDAAPGRLPRGLADRYRKLGDGKVAVRSSAQGEDSASASFAGQYETLLDVEGEAALALAVERCLASIDSERARVYADARDRPGEAARRARRMCVIVQRMVDARCAGVLFTVDPMTGRRSHAVVDAVPGLGDALASGHASPDHYVLDRDGLTLSATLAGDAPVLEPADRTALLEAARAAAAREGRPLDLEWAIDSEERIYWLQARPITKLGADPTELDTNALPEHVFTRCNIGEMFPGACTPLSFSFTARAIDVGMQRMHQRLGIRREISGECIFVAMFHRHLFLNLTEMAKMATQALGSSSDQMTLSICGRVVTEFDIQAPPPPPVMRRALNGSRYLRYLLGARRARRGIARLDAKLRAGLERDLAAEPRNPGAPARATACWESIDAHFGAIHDAMDLHLVSSAGSGVLSTVLLSMLAEGGTPTDAHHAQVAWLLAGAEGVESADIAAGADRVRDAIAAQPEGHQRFGAAEPQAALSWLASPASGDAADAFQSYLERHGHRTVKELELRQAEWREDPLPLVRSLQAAVRGVGSSPAAQQPRPEPSEQPALALRLLVRLAQRAVRSREETKSALVSVTTSFKQSYRQLGRLAAEAGLLPDADAVFFLTHAELGHLVRAGDDSLATRAELRRDLHPQLDALAFDDVFSGAGEPGTPAPPEPGTRSVQGAPVSRGRVEGVARVVRSLEDAHALERGEILIAAVTDVGWTPYFGLIAGLVTDVGSAVSHGAVVAREYGLPAVVNTRHATSVFRTGDRVRLDADAGRVTRIDAGPEPRL